MFTRVSVTDHRKINTKGVDNRCYPYSLHMTNRHCYG